MKADVGKPDPIEEALVTPVLLAGPGFKMAAGVLAFLSLSGLAAYLIQFRYGLGVTGLNRPTYWGIYITNFVFFIGISHAGTLISAILRLCKAEWRRAITRSAEVITVLVLFFGVGSILIDLGRIDRMLFIIQHANFRSPLLWDVCSISLYLTASSIYLYLPLIPDIAILRDRMPPGTWRHKIYRLLAIGWTGTPPQHARLERWIAGMAVVVLPIAVSVHTVVSWVFAMTIQPMWHSTIFGPYFVVGAIYSGIAAIFVAMVIIRKVYGLQDFMKPQHFNNMGQVFLVMCAFWLYFTFAEHLTSYYGAEPAHMAVLWTKITGKYAPHFWGMILTCFVIPFAILMRGRTRTITGCLVASVSVLIGMWLERFTIVVPTLINPRLPYPKGFYHPTWVEIFITIGFFSLFTLLYVLFTKMFPIISIWEIKEGPQGIKETTDRIAGYLPASLTRKTIVLLLLLLGISAAGAHANPWDPMAGRKVFTKKGCMQCHSIWGIGGKLGPDLSKAVRGKTMMQLGAEVWNHSPKILEKMKGLGMLPRPSLTTQEMGNLLSYLFLLNYYDEPGNPDRGEAIFLKQRCVHCHSVGGRGGKIGPAWDTLRELRSPIHMASAMWNKGPKMTATMAEAGIPRPRLEARDIADLVAFTQSVATFGKKRREYLEPGDPEKGGALFVQKRCVHCHSVRGKGGRVGPDLGRSALWIPVSEFAANMWNHGEPMWGVMSSLGISIPTFSPQEMADIIAFLYFTHFTDLPGNPARGKRVFAQKHCAVCHSDGVGGVPIGPELANSTITNSPLDAITGLYNHSEAMEKQISKGAILPWPVFTGTEMNDLVAYLATLRKNPSPGRASPPRGKEQR